MLAKNQCFEMTCDAFGQDAQGVCRHEGMAVFVPGLLPGERALVRIVKPEKRYAFGRVEKLLEKSPSRAEPFCPIYKRCGGCVCQHMTYEASLAFKCQQVQDLLQRVGGLSIEVPPVWGMAHPFGYRNKGAYPVAQTDGAPACGFFAPRSHDLVPLPENGCAIQGEDSARATQAVLNWMRENSVPAYDEQTGRGLVRHIMTRSTTSCELMVVVVVTHADIPKASRLIELLRAAVPVVEELGVELDFTSPGWLPEETLRTLGLHLIPSCGACLSNMALAPDGSIIPCQSWLSSAPLGNMLTDDWASVWNSERCAAIRAESAKMDHICQLQGGNREEGARC